MIENRFDGPRNLGSEAFGSPFKRRSCSVFTEHQIKVERLFAKVFSSAVFELDAVLIELSVDEIRESLAASAVALSQDFGAEDSTGFSEQRWAVDFTP